MRKLIFILLFLPFYLFGQQIDSISDGEGGTSVTNKLNAVIEEVDSLKSRVTENVNSNLFWGNGAGDGATVTGTANTAVGADALNLLEDGDDNCALGREALRDNAHGTRAVAIGPDALQQHFVGNYIVAVGYQALQSDISGLRNTAIGYKVMQQNVVGYNNTAVGYKALNIMEGTNGEITAYADAGGGQITVTSAAHGQSNGQSVTIQGTGPWADHSFSDNYDGAYNISNVATNTFEITAAYVSESTLLSFGYWGLLEGLANTALGYAAGDNIVKGNVNLMLGYLADAPDPDGDYQMNIGDLITGDMASGQKWAKIDGFMKLTPQAAAPSSPVEGWIYSNSTDHHLYFYNGSGWVQLDN